ncbi:nucleotidyltransferase domain-containing protein [Paenalcaligenes sp.]|uniref:nucleotidyltransferase domain-containing protein n=1 Tax=Paenalcaligenes sp. TaxID=1966342 RepID=UPI00344DDA24
MGRVKDAVAEPVITACEVARYILRSCESLREFESYMFGSSLSGVGSDFDILIIGPAGEPLSRLKAELRFAGKELPLDVLYMLPTEADETRFVTSAGCISLSQLARK